MASDVINAIRRNLAADPDDAVSRQALEFYNNNRGIKWIGCGRHRATFRHGTIVVKVPICSNGLIDNWHEAKLFKRHGRKGEIPYARCRMIKNGMLAMEYVEPCYFHSKTWASFVDCGQTGFTLNGHAVAYDFGIF